MSLDFSTSLEMTIKGTRKDKLFAEGAADRIGPAGLEGGGVGAGGREDVLRLPLGLDL